MQKKSIALFVICGLVAAMFFFSLGILTSRPAQAQPIYSKLSNFPRQSELWSVVGGTWNQNNQSVYFTVERDHMNRLPVLTGIHSIHGLLHRKIDSVWQPFISAQDVNRNTGFAAILPPGEYLLFLGPDATTGEYGLHASGYWALP